MTAPQPSDPSTPPPAPMEPLTSTFALRPRFFLPWAMYGSMLVIIVVFTLFFGFGAFRGSPQREAEGMRRAAEETAQFSAATESRAIQTKWKKFQRSLQATQEEYDALVPAVEKLRKRQQELEHSDEGKRIAADPARMDEFAALVSRPQPDAPQLADWQDDLQQLKDTAADALKQSRLLVDPPEGNAKTQRDRITAALQEARNNLVALDALARRAAQTAPAPVTLADTVQVAQDERQSQRAALLAKEKKALEQQADDQRRAQELAALREKQQNELEQQRIANELEAVKEAAKTKSERALLDAAKEAVAKERAHQEKLARFERALPEIRVLLSAVISNGKMRPQRFTWYSGPEGPMSLEDLRKHGVLELTEQGGSAMWALFASPSSKNDRPQGGLPATWAGHEDTYRRAQELLVEFSDILQEKKMLRP